jgi:hypothetical protein
MLQLKEKPGGFDATNWIVKWRPRGWVRGGPNCPLTQEKVVTIDYVIVELGNILWEKFREREDLSKGSPENNEFLHIQDNETMSSLGDKLQNLSKFWAVMTGVQVMRVKLHNKIGLDGDVIKHQIIPIGKMKIEVSLKNALFGQKHHSCQYRLKYLIMLLEHKMDCRMFQVETEIQDMPYTIKGNANLNKYLQKGVFQLMQEIELYKNCCGSLTPSNMMQMFKSDAVLRYNHFSHCRDDTGDVNRGRGPKLL